MSHLTGSVEEGLGALQGQQGDKYLEGEDVVLPGLPGRGRHVWLLCGFLGKAANDHEETAQPWSYSLPMGPWEISLIFVCFRISHCKMIILVPHLPGEMRMTGKSVD